MSSDAALRKSKSAGDLPQPSSASPTQTASDADHPLTATSDPNVERHAGPSRLGTSVSPLPTPSLPVPTLAPIRQSPRSPMPTPSPTVPQPPPVPPPRRVPQTRYGRIMAFLGFGRNADPVRRSNMWLVWNFTWGTSQTVVIIVLLVISTKLESKTVPGVNEWDACERPLGAWSSLWVARIFLALGVAFWKWRREQTLASRPDLESGNSSGAATPSVSRPTLGSLQSTHNHNTNTNDVNSPTLPYTNLYKRIGLLSSLLGFTWFLTAHILVYTSINTCRLSSPHLWWLVFGILCITYLMVLEVVLLTVIVFIIAPILFLFWNVLLMCLGRHPLQNPGIIKPEIGKLPKSVVDRIPLVMYIPPPPDPTVYPASPIKVPESLYTYPPKSPTTPNNTQKKRFRWFKKSNKNKSKPLEKDGKKKDEKDREQPQTWEEHWEGDGYPFVVLEGNRAACAICLMDFEEPAKKAGMEDVESEVNEKEAKSPAEGDEAIAEEQRQKELKLEDAGDGAQPLRLLECGHVFHKTCLDPWLTDVSGRCPVCQRAVEVPEPPKSKRRTMSTR